VGEILTRVAVPSFDPTLTPEFPPAITQTAVPTQLPPTEVPPAQTSTPFISPTEVNTPMPSLEERFHLGSFDLSSPFSFQMTPELMKALGFIFSDSLMKYKVNKTDKVETPYISDEIDKLFSSTATDNKGGNPGAAVLTDQPNMILELVHSMEPAAPGEFTRIIGSFLIKNPDKKDRILGQQVIITPDGQNQVTATIADVTNVAAEDFDNMDSENRFWGVYPDKDNVIFFRTDKAGISESIRGDRTPGVYYLILASCTPENGDYWVDPFNLVHTNAQLSYHNTRNRTLVTLKIVIPQN
jgi:hypothetical protein